MKRPESVTATCWVIIALSTEALIGLVSGFARGALKDLLHSIGTSASFSSTIAAALVIACLGIVLAIFMLRGANWARIVYLSILGLSAFFMVIMYARVPLSLMLMSVAKAVLFGTVLLRSPAKEYFEQRRPESPAGNGLDGSEAPLER